MSTPAQQQPAMSNLIDPALAIGGVKLAVGDLSRSADFYGRLLGLPPLSRERERASFGFDAARPLLELTRITDPVPAPAHSTGLFHVAWLHPSRGALADTVQRIARADWPFDGASDHGVSEALYLSDPDGLGIEIYVDRPREQWDRPPDGHGVRMYTRPLDLADLLAQAAGEPPAEIAPGTHVGHVHLKAADVARTGAFYRDALGFEMQAHIPEAAFFGAGGYHHHIGVNSWQSRGAGPAPDGAPGLRGVTLRLSGPAELEALERSLSGVPLSTPPARTDGDIKVLDPDGQPLTFSAA